MTPFRRISSSLEASREKKIPASLAGDTGANTPDDTARLLI
jgi:hypothetical protein